MAITKIKIHPAIGISRVGNSPDEFFIGPEKQWERPAPPGGFKDANCKVKRQAARFHLWGYDGDTPVGEVTVADATITWKVELANTKAAANTRNASVTGSARNGLKIKPGDKTLNGPLKEVKFDNGIFQLPGEAAITVPLGEARTDAEGRLIVLGGAGKSGSATGSTTIGYYLNNDGWYDDVSDGTIKATVTLNGVPTPIEAEGAWVVVAPPNFAPQIDNNITLYDLLYDIFVRQGRITPPTKPSFTNDIYPILRAAKTIEAVYKLRGSKHGTLTWPVPAGQARVGIFNKLSSPAGGGGNMPALQQLPTVPVTQYGWMEKWKNDDGADSHILNDWPGNHPSPPAQITPGGLDKAALVNACGGPFYPGIEAGDFFKEGATPATVATSKYIEPFRFDHTKVFPGDASAKMAIPWQADFKACGSGWWPVPRPNMVIPQGQTSYQNWDRDIGDMYEMVLEWHNAGFVIEQGSDFVETEKCPSTYITLLTPSLNFKDIPKGPGNMSRYQAMPIQFEVLNPGGTGSFEFLSGPTAPSLMRQTSDPFPLGSTSNTTSKKISIWIKYTTQAEGHSVQNDSVTIKHSITNETWTIDLYANTVARKKAAVALVLDRSGSMGGDRGDGQKKVDSLRQAASNFLALMLEADALSLVRYNHNADAMTPLTVLDAAGALNGARAAAEAKIQSSDLDPGGSTAIGDGIELGNTLVASASGYDARAVLVLTDGNETASKYIDDVAGSVTATTYAVGLGTPQNTSAVALQKLSGNNGGYMLITGDITGDKEYILRKYFIQILAGISNADIIYDPEGLLAPGKEHRIPFYVTEADSGLDVIVLTPHPELIDFSIETPLGSIIDQGVAAARDSVNFVYSKGIAFYRLSLPQEFDPGRPNRQGKWHVVLKVRGKKARWEGARLISIDSDNLYTDPSYFHSIATHGSKPVDPDADHTGTHGSQGNTGKIPLGLSYNLIVNAYTDLKLKSAVVQKSFEPEAAGLLRASLSQYGIPLDVETRVWVEVTMPGGETVEQRLKHVGEGIFQGTYDTTLTGVYSVRLRARGRSTDGHTFYRESTYTIPVWKGGDTPPERDEGQEDDRGGCLKKLLCGFAGFFKCLFFGRRNN